MGESLGVRWTSPVARWARAVGKGDAALERCGPLFRRAVLVVSPERPDGRTALRRAREAGAMVTALCAPERARDAREAGAETVMDPARQDPTWYRGAWSVIFDPAGRIGFGRASRALGPGGVYVTSTVRLPDRARAVLGRLSGGPRLLRCEG